MAQSEITDARSSDDPASKQVAEIPHLLDDILLDQPPMKIIVLGAISKHFRKMLNGSMPLKKLVLGAVLSRLHRCFSDISNDLEDGCEVFLIDQTLPLGVHGCCRSTQKAGISLVTSLAIADKSKKRVFYESLERKAKRDVVQPTQGDAWMEVQSAFPSKKIPAQLEMAVITARKVKNQSGEECKVVYRVSASLRRVSLPQLVKILTAIKRALSIPHRRRGGILRLDKADLSYAGMQFEVSDLLEADPTFVEEQWSS